MVSSKDLSEHTLKIYRNTERENELAKKLTSKSLKPEVLVQVEREWVEANARGMDLKREHQRMEDAWRAEQRKVDEKAAKPARRKPSKAVAAPKKKLQAVAG